jgi:uncharacterized protein YjiS (DUF1127 family)
MTAHRHTPRLDSQVRRADMAVIHREAERLRARAFGDLARALGRAIAKDIPEAYRRWQAERRTARALAALDPRMLNDIGLIPGDIDSAAARAAGRRPAIVKAPSTALPQGSGVIDFLVSVERVLAKSLFAHERAKAPANSNRSQAA